MGDALLVVAGEASGDRAAAGVVRALGGGASAFGLGGPALAGVGVELVADLRASTAMGVTEVAARALSIGRALACVLHAARRRRPRVALLVNYTEFNMRVAAALHAAGARVLWYIAPQIWAWRPRRAGAVRRAIDRMAVVLPFEEELWRREGVDARYVGHPALEGEVLDRARARRALELTPYASAVAILPGSRPHEVRRLLAPMLDAYEIVREERASVDARLLLAPSLDRATRAWGRVEAHKRHVAVVDVDPVRGAHEVLRAFDAALCASGTASLEAALARAVPVVAYRVGAVTELVARHMVTVEHIALPNLLLRRAAFAELLQGDARAARLAEALDDALERRGELLKACDDVQAALGGAREPSREVASMLRAWLGDR
jgi:lipid-A-disaccharide synthase